MHDVTNEITSATVNVYNAIDKTVRIDWESAPIVTSDDVGGYIFYEIEFFMTRIKSAVEFRIRALVNAHDR